MILELLGGRKAAACITAIIVGIAATVLKGDIPAGLADLLKWVVTAYVAGNVGSDIVAGVVTPKPPGSQPVADAISKDEGEAKPEAVKAAAEETPVAPSTAAQMDNSEIMNALGHIANVQQNQSTAIGQIQSAVSIVLQVATGQRPPQN